MGGDARRGLADLVSTSPVKSAGIHLSANDDQFIGSPARKRGHAHRRSAAISGHDLPSVLAPRDMEHARLSYEESSQAIPAPPPAASDQSPISTAISSHFDAKEVSQSSPTSIDNAKYAPDSRAKVGFSDNVEIIPRPLSPISSASGSAISTPTSRSVRDSISSMLDLGSMTPSPTRLGRSPLASVDNEDMLPQSYTPDSSGGGDEREGRWLRQGAEVAPDLITQRARDKETPYAPQYTVDRRRSAPSLVPPPSQYAAEDADSSTASLQDSVQSQFVEHLDETPATIERRSSVKKVKAWATSVMHRGDKSMVRPKSSESLSGETTRVATVPWLTVSTSDEPDLEELFSHDPFSESDSPIDRSMPRSRVEFGPMTDFQPVFDASDSTGSIIDLNEAFGSPNTPSKTGRLQGFGARRQLHSSRMMRESAGMQGQAQHRRTESAPVLTQFDYPPSNSPVQSPMDDVFEEDEGEEEEDVRAVGSHFRRAFLSSSTSNAEANRDDEQEGGTQTLDASSDAGLARSSRSSGTVSSIDENAANSIQLLSSLSAISPTYPTAQRRPSLIEDTIVEEPSVEIVGDEEEPRASLITKSSDSSETPTILADHSGAILTIPSAQASLMTPTTYAASTFSTPDFARHQDSFETSRLGTSASSMTDCRTMSSFATETGNGNRPSVDDVPSLTSSRSTAIGSMHQVAPRRAAYVRSESAPIIPSSNKQTDGRRKRASIQSLTKLVGASFGEGRSSRSQADSDELDLTLDSGAAAADKRRKKENRLSRLMFWKHRQPSGGSSSGR